MNEAYEKIAEKTGLNSVAKIALQTDNIGVGNLAKHFKPQSVFFNKAFEHHRSISKLINSPALRLGRIVEEYRINKLFNSQLPRLGKVAEELRKNYRISNSSIIKLGEIAKEYRNNVKLFSPVITELSKQRKQYHKILESFSSLKTSNILNLAEIANKNQNIFQSAKIFKSYFKSNTFSSYNYLVKEQQKFIKLQKSVFKEINSPVFLHSAIAVPQTFADKFNSLVEDFEEILININSSDSLERKKVAVNSSFNLIDSFLGKIENSQLLQKYPNTIGIILNFWGITLSVILFILAPLYDQLVDDDKADEILVKQSLIENRITKLEKIYEKVIKKRLVTTYECFLYNVPNKKNKFCSLTAGFKFEIVEYKGKWVKVKLEDIAPKDQYKWLLKKYTKRLGK